MKRRYYEVIEVSVLVAGRYSFTGTSPVRMSGHLRGGDFDPADPDRNRISQDVKKDGEEQFRITAGLQPGH